MTEEEAKKKWCPYTRASCIGSACMAWRIVPEEKIIDTAVRFDRSIEFELREKVVPGYGYCGLAGKP